MKRIITILLVCILLFSGCDIVEERKPFNKLQLAIEQGNGCEFDASIIAEYDIAVRHFALRCKVEKDGDYIFSVTVPETIKDVSGRVDEVGGELTYDGIILTFPLMADDVLSPLCGPWLLYRSIRTGLVRFASKDTEGYSYMFDETFRGESFRVELITGADGIPVQSKIYWADRCIIKMAIDNFRFL